MKANEILYAMVDDLNERDVAYRAGQLKSRIEYEIAKVDEEFSVLKIKFFYPPIHKCTMDYYDFTMFFEEDFITCRTYISDAFHKSKHIAALELVNRLNKKYLGISFAVDDSVKAGCEKISMDKYINLETCPTPRLWDLEIVNYATVGDRIFSEDGEDLIPFYNYENL